jgi:hypothetical protein
MRASIALRSEATELIRLQAYAEAFARDCGFADDFVDDGPPFDPLAHSSPDLDAPAEQRPIGGLGIAIVRALVDRGRYRRKGDCNHLRLVRGLACAEKTCRPATRSSRRDSHGPDRATSGEERRRWFCPGSMISAGKAGIGGSAHGMPCLAEGQTRAFSRRVVTRVVRTKLPPTARVRKYQLSAPGFASWNGMPNVERGHAVIT